MKCTVKDIPIAHRRMVANLNESEAREYWCKTFEGNLPTAEEMAEVKRCLVNNMDTIPEDELIPGEEIHVAELITGKRLVAHGNDSVPSKRTNKLTPFTGSDEFVIGTLLPYQYDSAG